MKMPSRLRTAAWTAATALLLPACGAGHPDGGLPAAARQAPVSVAVQQPPAAGAARDPLQREASVQKLYLAYFGRPADPAGLQNLSAALDAAGAATDILQLDADYLHAPAVRALVDAFGYSEESRSLYAGNAAQFVNAVYRNLFGRDADRDGLLFWSNAVASGHLTRGRAALAIMAGAYANPSEQGRADATLIDHKAGLAVAFTRTLDTADEVAAYRGDTAAAQARAMLAAVTDPASVDLLQKSLDPAYQPVAFDTLDARRFSGHALPAGGHAVVGDTQSWTQLWQQHIAYLSPAPAAPQVDFASRTVIGVFVGSRPSGCHAVGIRRIYRNADRLVVEYVEGNPQPGAICAAVMTAPSHIVSVPRVTGLAVEFVRL